MKEILESNAITKYLAGMATKQESKAIEIWLKENPQYKATVSILKQRVESAKQVELVA